MIKTSCSSEYPNLCFLPATKEIGSTSGSSLFCAKYIVCSSSKILPLVNACLGREHYIILVEDKSMVLLHSWQLVGGNLGLSAPALSPKSKSIIEMKHKFQLSCAFV